MTIEEQFNEILLNDQLGRLTPFLKQLTSEQKKLLALFLKKIGKSHFEFTNGTPQQQEIYQQAAFVCFNQADFDKSLFPLWYLRQNNLKEVINWYVPAWFSDYVNKTTSMEEFSLGYEWVMYMTEAGVLQPGKELIAREIPQMIYECHQYIFHYKPENLLKRPVTLQEHIWYLFEFETNLHYSDRFLKFDKEVPREKISWQHVFKQLAAEGKID